MYVCMYVCLCRGILKCSTLPVNTLCMLQFPILFCSATSETYSTLSTYRFQHQYTVQSAQGLWHGLGLWGSRYSSTTPRWLAGWKQHLWQCSMRPKVKPSHSKCKRIPSVGLELIENSQFLVTNIIKTTDARAQN
jgi:hypothetical protein